MRHSYSSLTVLAKCERKFAYRYLEGLVPDGMDRPKPFRGTAFHAVLQADLIARGAARNTLLERPSEIEFVRGCKLSIDWSAPASPTIMSPNFGPEVPLSGAAIIRHISAWWSMADDTWKEQYVEELGSDIETNLWNLYSRYNSHYGGDDLARYSVLLTEYEWNRIAQVGDGVTLSGRVDAVLFDNELNMVVVRDYKTHQQWPTSNDNVTDLMNSQLHLQAWGIEPFLLANDQKSVGVVQFDRIRAKMPTTPKLTASGKLSASVTDFDAETYVSWARTMPVPEITAAEAKKGITSKPAYQFDQDVYDKLVEEKRNAFFRRSQKPYSERSALIHVWTLGHQALRAESLDTTTALMVPSEDCSWCEFLTICRSDMIGGRTDEVDLAEHGLRQSNM